MFSVTRNMLLITQISEQKATFPVKKPCGSFFLVVSNMTKVREQFQGTRKSFDIFCASYEFYSMGPRRLMQHQFVKERQ